VRRGWLLTKTIVAGRKAGVISERSVEAVIVDTTVMEKAIAHPTDARLYQKARQRLVTLAQEAGLSLRQSYARLAPRLSGQVGRYSHARQFKWMRKALRRTKSYTSRVMRDIQRQLGGIGAGGNPDGHPSEAGLRGSRLSWSRCPDHGGLHRRAKARDDACASARPASAQRDRAGDWTREDRPQAARSMIFSADKVA